MNDKTFCKNLKLRDYEKFFIYLKDYIMFAIIGIIFFRNIFFSFILSFFSLFISKLKLKNVERIRKKELLLEFKNFLNIYLSAILTGDEAFSAFKYAFYEMKKTGRLRSILFYKLEEVIKKTNVAMEFEHHLLEFAGEIKIREIEMFAKCMEVAIKTTGNIEDIIIETINIIANKLEMDDEISKMFYEKKYELKIMTVVPILIYIFLSVTAKEYIAPIYENYLGIIILSFALGLIMLAYIIGEKMMDVELENL